MARIMRSALVSGVLATLLTAPLQAQESLDEEQSLQKLTGILSQTATLRATVEQLLIDQDGREIQETRAELLMRKPASFSWHVTAPWEELMVTDGALIWRYEPDLEQVTIQNFDTQLDRTPVMLLNGSEAAIAAAYQVSGIDMGDGVLWRFILLPRQPSSLFERLSLTFSGAVLQEMQFEDSLGQQTSLSFSAVERNVDIDAASFHFVPPDDVEIIDNTDMPQP